MQVQREFSILDIDFFVQLGSVRDKSYNLFIQLGYRKVVHL